MRNIILSKNEYEYLINNLSKDYKKILEKIIFVDKMDNVELELDDDTAYNIWQLSTDNIAFHFDKNYEPTEEGLILENFIDKFYF
jgi:hypothetical protein